MHHSHTDALALSRLQDLREAARKLDIEIRLTDLSDPEISTQSGACKVRGKDWILIDNRLPVHQQIERILHLFKKFDWEDVYLPSWIRDHLENPETLGIPS